jgi:hypothetical protein
MLVRLAFGSREGQVVDFLPHEARAMLADGRAVLPDAPPAPAPDRVVSREDRGMPRGKRRAHR